MVDFDEKEGFTMEDAIERLNRFIEKGKEFGKENLFKLFATDKGMHAFLVNRYVWYNSRESETMLRLLGNDEDHIRFVSLGKHCMRIGPKLYRDGVMQTKEKILSESISKMCYKDTCTIGYGKPLDYISRVLLLQDHMISHIKKLYRENFEAMTRRMYSPQVNDVVYAPEPHLVQDIRNHIISVMTDLDMVTNDMTLTQSYPERKVNAERYTELIEDKLIGTCKLGSISEVRKNSIAVTNAANPGRCMNRMNGIRGPEVPFDFYLDRGSDLLILVTYDIAMLDFDTKDGTPKQAVVNVLERFITSQRLIPENDRVTKDEICFKLYETDNGVHAWPISHSLPFYSDQAIRLQLETCADNMYAVFSSRNGYSIRMSPKVFTDSVRKIPNSPEIIKTQFVQKEGVSGVLYVGNKSNIDPYIEEFVDIIYQTQQQILAVDNIAQRMLNEDMEVVYSVSKYMREMYLSMKNKRNDTYARRWAVNTMNCK
jgi:hypothetical protein